MPTAGRYIPDPIAFDILPVRIEFGELPFRCPNATKSSMRCRLPCAVPGQQRVRKPDLHIRQASPRTMHRRTPRGAMLRLPSVQRVDLITWVRWNCQRSTMRNPTWLGVTYAGARPSARPAGSDFPLW